MTKKIEEDRYLPEVDKGEVGAHTPDSNRDEVIKKLHVKMLAHKSLSPSRAVLPC